MPRRRSKLRRRSQLRLIEHFVAGTTARTAAGFVDVHRNAAVLYYHKLRGRSSCGVADELPFGGEVEVDESYFGGHRKGRRGRGAGGKTVVFGILKRGERVYTAVPPDLARATLLPILRQKVRPDALVITDGLRVYDTLDAEGFHHERVSHDGQTLGNAARADGRCTSSASRTSGARRNSTRVVTMASPKAHFELFLNECEWRFNYGPPRRTAQILTPMGPYLGQPLT